MIQGRLPSPCRRMPRGTKGILQLRFEHSAANPLLMSLRERIMPSPSFLHTRNTVIRIRAKGSTARTSLIMDTSISPSRKLQEPAQVRPLKLTSFQTRICYEAAIIALSPNSPPKRESGGGSASRCLSWQRRKGWRCNVW